MLSMIERIKESKPHYIKVIQDFQKLASEITDLINDAGLNQFFADGLKIPLSTFYYKRRTKSFTPYEMIHIINLLVGDEDEDEDEEDVGDTENDHLTGDQT